MRYILKVQTGFMIVVVLQLSKICISFSNLILKKKQFGYMSFNTKVKLIPGVCNGDCLLDWLVTVVCVITPFLFDIGYCPIYEICYIKTVSLMMID
jgi:hypothetical protein